VEAGVPHEGDALDSDDYNHPERNMNILILEDEPPIAEYIRDLTSSLIGSRVDRIDIAHTLKDAEVHLAARPIDLCLLDLNLSQASGFELLKHTVAHSFHTVIISAHTDQAFEAFQYGVLDFVPKPIDRHRLNNAFQRFFGTAGGVATSLKYLVVRKKNALHLISVDEVLYFEAQRYLVCIHLQDGRTELIEKPLNRLIQILPKHFLRVHRSFVVDMRFIEIYRHKGGGTYELKLKNQKFLPLSAQAYRFLNKLADK
jgi:DNA-binding LytR/AlgR family response regulator